METKTRYKRILLKLSGEALAGDLGYGIHPETIQQIAREISDVVSLQVQIGIVIGGGNIHRGISGAAKGMDRAGSDYMGMLATCINALALQDALESINVQTRVQSAIEMAEIAEPYIRRRAIRHLEKGRVVIFAAGTGNPFLTTDTAAALRAAEIDAEIIFKATKVNGIYNKDPVKYEDAIKYDELSYMEVLNQNLQVMDLTAISFCEANRLPILTFNLRTHGNIRRAVTGEVIGTIVRGTSA